VRLECLPRGDAVLRLFYWVTQADDNLPFFLDFSRSFRVSPENTEVGMGILCENYGLTGFTMEGVFSFSGMVRVRVAGS